MWRRGGGAAPWDGRRHGRPPSLCFMVKVLQGYLAHKKANPNWGIGLRVATGGALLLCGTDTAKVAPPLSAL